MSKDKKTSFVFVTGGVISSVGKGVVTSILGALLKSRGYSVILRKADPYLNVDSGTMSPYQHGEVFVTDDGCESDLDLGHYERLTDVRCTENDSITAGSVYKDVIQAEREGKYLGTTVQVVPHIVDRIMSRFSLFNQNCDFVLCEIGGTVGDMEALPFYESVRRFTFEYGRKNIVFIHITFIPFLNSSYEFKTKPSQHSIREIRSFGISPDILICRSHKNVPQKTLKKLAFMCGIDIDHIIGSQDRSSSYQCYEHYYRAGLDKIVLSFFNEDVNKSHDKAEKNFRRWKNTYSIQKGKNRLIPLNIGIVGKYVRMKDTYISLRESLFHASVSKYSLDIEWISSEDLIKESVPLEKLRTLSGIIVPGGFGERGIEGKLLSAQICRKHKIPFFGICLGMQLALVEYARNVLNLKDFYSFEFQDKDFCQDEQKDTFSSKHVKDSMRLGSMKVKLKENTKIQSIYEEKSYIYERHRHRHSFNRDSMLVFDGSEMILSAFSEDGTIIEACELKDHPWYLGVQYHPEFLSRPFNPHPLFVSFLASCAVK